MGSRLCECEPEKCFRALVCACVCVCLCMCVCACACVCVCVNIEITIHFQELGVIYKVNKNQKCKSGANVKDCVGFFHVVEECLFNGYCNHCCSEMFCFFYINTLGLCSRDNFVNIAC